MSSFNEAFPLIWPVVYLVGLRHNSVIKAYYAHLKSKGNEPKVAIVACLRQLLSIMNTMVRNNELWRETSKDGAS